MRPLRILFLAFSVCCCGLSNAANDPTPAVTQPQETWKVVVHDKVESTPTSVIQLEIVHRDTGASQLVSLPWEVAHVKQLVLNDNLAVVLGELTVPGDTLVVVKLDDGQILEKVRCEGVVRAPGGVRFAFGNFIRRFGDPNLRRPSTHVMDVADASVSVKKVYPPEGADRDVPHMPTSPLLWSLDGRRLVFFVAVRPWNERGSEDVRLITIDLSQGVASARVASRQVDVLSNLVVTPDRSALRDVTFSVQSLRWKEKDIIEAVLYDDRHWKRSVLDFAIGPRREGEP